MSKKPNTTAVGVFVLIGFLILFGIIGKFMLDKFNSSQNNLVVMYFQESVKGLSVGSPVVLEGVEVGKVISIELITGKNPLDFNIPVYVKFQKLKDINDSSFINATQRRKKLEQLIEHGLRAKLATQSYLTGQLMIELVFLPNTPIILKRKHNTGVLEIPTTLSTIKELSQGIQKLPLKEMVDRANKILSALEENLPTTLPRINNLLDAMTVVTKKMEQMTPASKKILVNTDKTLIHVNTTLSDISAAAKSMKNLTDYLEQHPEAVLKGKAK